jgi:hypothetical protein
MASFSDLLTPGDSRAIHAYVSKRAHNEPTLVQRLAGWLARNTCLPVSVATD